MTELLDELRVPFGIVVAASAGESTYFGDALQFGDVIYTVNKLPVTSVEALNKAIGDLKPDDPLVLQVQRGGRLLFVTMQMD